MKNTKTTAYKILTSYGFYLSVAAVCLLCLFSEVSLLEDTGKKFTVIEIIVRKSELKSRLERTMLDVAYVILNNSNNWFSLFVPIAASFSFAPLLCDEHEFMFSRSEIFRSSRIRYSFSEFFTSTLMGGFAVALGFVLFSLICFGFFPKNATAEDINEKVKATVYLARLMHMFFYGVIYSAFAAFLAAITKNKYLVICVPFFMKYLLNLLSYKIMSIPLQESRYHLIKKVAVVIDPDALSGFSGLGELKKRVAVYNAGLYLVLLLLYILIRERKFDCGE